MQEQSQDIIADIIPMKIDSKMRVSTLIALETIFYLRLQLAQISWSDDEPYWQTICQDRFEKIAKALRNKYKRATALNEKIEILEHLQKIGEMLGTAEATFAKAEAQKLPPAVKPGEELLMKPGKETKELSSLARQLRLAWLTGTPVENEQEMARKLLSIPSLEGRAGERLSTLAQITDSLTEKDRQTLYNQYYTLLEATLYQPAGNEPGKTKEIGSLLTLSLTWQSDPSFRKKLKELTKQILIPYPSLQIENRLLAIAATLQTRIDTLTRKFTGLDPIPA
ncbi:MAG: hypothetical protein NC453_12520 [Muribaculum sp.]|nr:hypothetical protein [Muribaculum sp.]